MTRLWATENRLKALLRVSEVSIVIEWGSLVVAAAGLYVGSDAISVASSLAGVICGLIGFLFSAFVGWASLQYRKKSLALLFWAWFGAVVAMFLVPAFFTA